MTSIPEIFGSLVFNDDVMKDRLADDVYKSLHKTIERGTPLDPRVADSVAEAMKNWAIEKGATHFTHWFQPMTGITAEKHESFISPLEGGSVIMEFSGKELIKGESDASSFPSGGLRATFEARGYTAWDPTSYAFIKDKSLCIPSVFCSWSGESLDTKTPLLKSMERISAEALRVLKLFGNSDAKYVTSTVGAEQEYFLIDKNEYNKRRDLIYCGRTLFGARPPKGQEVEHHYYGVIKPRIAAFMHDLDEELWKLGVYAKTEHNEAAPAQHELAPIFTVTNRATDQNQLMMEVMKRVADRHGLVCLLHEKPFAGVNGSGKHINWSLTTDKGRNLFEPGDSPSSNAQFLLFLCAVIKAVDEYQELLRLSVATAGNDHRLGSTEAPPAIISIFLGDELAAILDSVEHREDYLGSDAVDLEIGVDVLPRFPRDISDRNRTSPFAFTGNKFEFRMPGSSATIAGPCTIINTIVADELSRFADRLEKADDFNKLLNHIIRHTIHDHKRIIFNGDGYSEEWRREAAERGLLDLGTTVDALPYLISEKSVELFTRNNVYSEAELRSRLEILLDNYCDTIEIEVKSMLDMARKEIYPAVVRYMKDLADTINAKKTVSGRISTSSEVKMLDTVSAYSDRMYEQIAALDDADKGASSSKAKSALERVTYTRDVSICAMKILRETVDELELICPADVWPVPSYGKLMFNF